MAVTTWKWADNVFGKQKSGPNTGAANDSQYPDCGPSRIYTLENLLYGLEEVITPLLEQIAAQTPAIVNETSGDYAQTGASTQIGTGACTTVTIWLLSTAAAPAQIEINSGSEVILEAGYSMTINVNNLSRIKSYQTGAEGDTLYYKYQ